MEIVGDACDFVYGDRRPDPGVPLGEQMKTGSYDNPIDHFAASSLELFVK
jgi:hypothetical protein